MVTGGATEAALVLALAPAAAPGVELRERYGAGLQVAQRGDRSTDLAAAPIDVDRGRSLPGAACGLSTDWSALSRLAWRRRPYPHAVGEQLFVPELVDAWLRTLETVSMWRPQDGGFYAADAIAITPSDAPDAMMREMLQPAGLRMLEDAASTLFETTLRLHGPVIAHRMQPGQGVGIHSDKPAEGEETHRIVVFLARVPRPADEGGHFLVLDGPTVSHARGIIELTPNTAVAFSLNDESYHAVTSVIRGTRFSLVLSFRGVPPDEAAATA
jgi:2OG-Fe(II) oxygenase superfamily